VLRGKYRQAERDLLHALRLFGPHRGRPAPEQLSAWNELGIVYKYLGKFEKARKCYRAAIRHCDSCLTGSARYELLANLYHNLGGLEHAQRRFRRAEPHARKSVEYRLRVRPKNPLSIAADRVALAAILDGLGKFAESQALYLSALRTYRRAYGESHREIALVLNNLAAVYQKTGRTGPAEKMYRTALAMKIETLGKAHPDVAVTMNNLAMLLAAQRRSLEAERYFEKAHKLLAKALGQKHPNVRAVGANLERLRLKINLPDRGVVRSRR
jgi:tetratricopeptide (TPR) repeat protein